MRKHQDEIIRFANSEPDTKVWFKYNECEWEKTNTPTWGEESNIYIVDDEYAELRKESIDTGRPIQVKDSETGKWVKPNYKLGFCLPLENYRLEPEQFKYPIYKKHVGDGLVVKFTGLEEGEIVKTGSNMAYDIFDIGYKSKNWCKHTETNVWEDYDYKEPVFFYKWERATLGGEVIEVSKWVTDEYAKNNNFEKVGWKKIEKSKRTWDY